MMMMMIDCLSRHPLPAARGEINGVSCPDRRLDDQRYGCVSLKNRLASESNLSRSVGDSSHESDVMFALSFFLSFVVDLFET